MPWYRSSNDTTAPTATPLMPVMSLMARGKKGPDMRRGQDRPPQGRADAAAIHNGGCGRPKASLSPERDRPLTFSRQQCDLLRLG